MIKLEFFFTQKVIIAIVAVGIVSGVFGYLVTMRYTKFANINKEIKKINKEIKQAEEKIAKIPQIKKEIDAKKEAVNRLAMILPSEEEASPYSFKAILDNKARKANIKINAVGKGEKKRGPTRGGNFEDITYKVLAEGSCHNSIMFMSLLEQDSRFMQIDSFTLIPSTGQIGRGGVVSNILRIDLVITTYVYKP